MFCFLCHSRVFSRVTRKPRTKSEQKWGEIKSKVLLLSRGTLSLVSLSPHVRRLANICLPSKNFDHIKKCVFSEKEEFRVGGVGRGRRGDSLGKRKKKKKRGTEWGTVKGVPFQLFHNSWVHVWSRTLHGVNDEQIQEVEPGVGCSWWGLN